MREGIVPIPTDRPVWEQVYTVAPLVLVGSREEDGGYDLAPKHLALPVGWQNLFAFVCTPRHHTYANVARHGQFTVSFPTPDQILATSLAAGARAEDGSKPSLAVLSTFPASAVDGVLVEGAHLFLECELERTIDDLGDYSLVIGRIVAASAAEVALRSHDRDDADVVHQAPLLAHVSPDRFAAIDDSRSFPFPADLQW
ncbi:MAG: flavin reductase [Acidimicrobiia bacterium]|nr:flavin reductase [Acidimicrobiia bacterium]